MVHTLSLELINLFVKVKVNDLVFSVWVVEELFSDFPTPLSQSEVNRKGSVSTSSDDDTDSYGERNSDVDFGFGEDDHFEIQKIIDDMVTTNWRKEDIVEEKGANYGESIETHLKKDMIANNEEGVGLLVYEQRSSREVENGSHVNNISAEQNAGPISSLGPIIQIPWEASDAGSDPMGRVDGSSLTSFT